MEKFDPQEALSLIENIAFSSMIGVTTIMEMMLDVPISNPIGSTHGNMPFCRIAAAL